MAVSNKPLIWLPFAAGGMLAALLLPALMLLVLLDGLDLVPAAVLAHDRVHALVAQPLVAVAVFAVLALVLWHAAHRLRMTVQDLGVRNPAPRRWLARACYLLATLGTIALALVLLML
jgi:fumarate reductase subunit D